MTAPEVRPATSLPWVAEQIGVSDAGPNGVDVFDIGPCDREGAMRVRVATVAGNNAAYIVHACNALPALEAQNAELRAALRNLLEAADAGSWKERRKDEARALLAKLPT